MLFSGRLELIGRWASPELAGAKVRDWHHRLSSPFELDDTGATSELGQNSDTASVRCYCGLMSCLRQRRVPE